MVDDASRLAIYLDLNHWYALADAKQGASTARPRAATLERLRLLRSQDEIVLPLSSVHYMEVTENHRDRQREAVADVMEELGDFWTLAPTALIVTEEIDIALNGQVGKPTEIRATPKMGRGFGFAFGAPGQLRITGPDDSMARLRERVGAQTIEQWEAWANQIAERALLQGDRQVMGQPVPGYDPYAARRLVDEELARIQRMVDNLRNNSNLRNRLDDVVGANELAVEILEQFVGALGHAGIEPADFLLADNAKERMNGILRAMPSRRVSMAIKAGYLRDLNHRWRISDIRDIAALSLAVPYCDVVVTDRQVADALHRTGLSEAFGTTIFSDLSELDNYLGTYFSDGSGGNGLRVMPEAL